MEDLGQGKKNKAQAVRSSSRAVFQAGSLQETWPASASRPLLHEAPKGALRRSGQQGLPRPHPRLSLHSERCRHQPSYGSWAKAGPAGEAVTGSPAAGRRPVCLSLTPQRTQFPPRFAHPAPGSACSVPAHRRRAREPQHCGRAAAHPRRWLRADGHCRMSSASPPARKLSHATSPQGRDPRCHPLRRYITKSSCLPSGEGRTSLVRRCSHSHLFSAGRKSWEKDGRHLALARDMRDAEPMGTEGQHCPPLWARAGGERQSDSFP